MSQNAAAGGGNISSFKIFSNTGGGSVDLTGAVAEFTYYESVLSNVISATVTVYESGAGSDGPQESTLDSLPIRGGETCIISATDAIGNELNIPQLYVNRVRDGDPNTRTELYYLDLSPKEYFANEQIRVMKRYEGQISDSVEEVIRLVQGQVEEVESTGLEYNFLGNDRKPFYICTWLASKAVPTQGVGDRAGFLFYQTRDGFNFRSIDGLLSGSPIKKYIYNDTANYAAGSEGKILNYKIESDIDLKQNLSLGTYNNRSIFWDLAAMDYRVVNYRIDDQSSKLEKAGVDFQGDMVAKEFTQSPTRLMSVILDVGNNPPGTGDDQLDSWKSEPVEPNFKAFDTMVQTVMRYNQLFTIKTNVILPGDFEVKAGDLIECEFASVDGEKKDTVNTQTGGIYMVAHVAHKMTPGDTFTSLGLVRDSFGKKTGF